MIKIFLLGGLGNQMFEYAFARSLALRKGTELQLATRRFFRNDVNGRVYRLNKLNLPNDIKIMSGFQEFITRKKFNFAKKIFKYTHNRILRDFYTDNAILLCEPENYDKYIPEFMRYDFGGENIIILGYFQTQKYFSDCDTQIKKELKVSTPPSEKNAAMIKELESCESVCVHVRRGDYLTENFVNVCDYQYYDRAIKYILDKVKSPVFYFFSNTHEDIEWLKNNWKFPDANIKYIDFNNPDYEELRLMYSCKHFVIANSSFSWWGSYLSSNPGKIICAPSKWIDERPIEETNIFMSDWKIIS